MSRTHKDSKKVTGRGRERHISVRGVRMNPPDLRKLSRALVQLAMAQAEAEAQARAESTAASDTVAPGGPDAE
jgi:hypothetical protein